jgi:hypothetical protein
MEVRVMSFFRGWWSSGGGGGAPVALLLQIVDLGQW